MQGPDILKADFEIFQMQQGSLLKYNSLPQFLKSSLSFLQKYKNVRRQNFYQRLLVTDLLKTKGNKLFQNNFFQEACFEYEQALSIFQYLYLTESKSLSKDDDLEDVYFENYEGTNVEEKTAIKKLKTALYNNLAACYLKSQDYINAKVACDQVIYLDPTQTKALYRRAKAIASFPKVNINHYNAALNDLSQALKYSPKDSMIQQSIAKIQMQLTMLNKKPNNFKGMFMRKNESSQENTSLKEKEDILESIKKTNKQARNDINLSLENSINQQASKTKSVSSNIIKDAQLNSSWLAHGIKDKPSEIVREKIQAKNFSKAEKLEENRCEVLNNSQTSLNSERSLQLSTECSLKPDEILYLESSKNNTTYSLQSPNSPISSYLENNYFNQIESKSVYPSEISKEKTKKSAKDLSSSLQDEDQQNFISEMVKNASKLNKPKEKGKVSRFMNYLILFIAMILLLITIVIQTNGPEQSQLR